MKLVVVGDIVTDVLAVHTGALAVGSDTDAEIRLMGGGSAANTAAWAAAAGVPVDLVAVVGSDAAGTDRLAELSAAGVGRAAVRRAEGASTGSVIVLAHATERTMICDRGVNLLLSPADVDAGLALGATHLHLSGYTLLDRRSRPAGLHALAAASARGLTTSVDAASAAPLRRTPEFLSWVRDADLLFANRDEALVLAPSADPAVSLTSSVRSAIVKLGAEGAVWARGDSVWRVPAAPAEVVDPTGAGDAFAGGLLASWLSGASPSEALRAGAAVGARAVGVVGGRPSS